MVMTTIEENPLNCLKLSMSKTNDLKSLQQDYYRSNHHHRITLSPKSIITVSIIIRMTWILLMVFMAMTWPLSSLAHSPPIPSSHTSSLPMTFSNAALRQRLLFGSSNKQQSDPFSNNDFNYYHSSLQRNKNNLGIKNNRLDKLRHLLAKAKAEASLSLYSPSHSMSINPLRYFYQHQQQQNKGSKEPTCEELRFLWSIKQLVLLDELSNNNYFRDKNKVTSTINVNNNNDISTEREIEDDTNVGIIDNEDDNDQEILRKMLVDIPKEKQVYITKIEPSNSKEHDDSGVGQIKSLTETTTMTSEIIDDKNSNVVNQNKPLETTEAETVSPFGIVHNSPSSARRGSQSQLQPAAETVGFFGEFFEDFFPLPNRTNLVKSQRLNRQQLRDRYLNGYNLRNGKQGLKISSPSRYGNEESYNGGIGQQRSKNQNRLKQNAESMLLSLPSSSISSSLSSSSSSLPSSSRMLLPGFWHEKPVKPSVNLIN
ncbi:hypothetical protein DERF_003026 [Dermatophagoides farinae]|uniref:Uncharacterized protein n=1 Tax=Dermatophagoides farinae TaxID=6954 RepID=A0A922LCB8_DERFA|nr:hypothetical protein DERF_003026 [Dermatophagoides farinae]